MEKEVLYSPYFHNVVASRKKIFLGALCDYFLVFILTVIAFVSIGSPILSNLDVTKSNNEAISSSETALNKIVGETHIQTYNESNGKLISPEIMAKNYIITLAKTSYYVNNELSFPISDKEKTLLKEEDTFLNEEERNYSLNPLAYYFCYFKEQHSELNFYTYGGTDYSINKEKGLYEYAYGYSDSSYLSYFETKVEGLSKYETLSLAKAKLITDYLYYNDSGASKTYSALAKAYSKASNIFIKEVENNYLAYKNEQSNFDKAYSNATLGYFITLYLCYSLAFIILETLPIFNKRKITLGYYVHKLAYAKENEERPRWYQFLVKSFTRYFMYLSVPSILLILFSQSALLFYSFGFFRFAYLIFFSLALLAISNILMLNNNNHQGLAELAGALLIKDIDELESNDPEFAKKESGQNGR